MEKIFALGIEITLLDAETKAAQPVKWLVWSCERNDPRMNPKDYQEYITMFIIPDPGLAR